MTEADAWFSLLDHKTLWGKGYGTVLHPHVPSTKTDAFYTGEAIFFSSPINKSVLKWAGHTFPHVLGFCRGFWRPHAAPGFPRLDRSGSPFVVVNSLISACIQMTPWLISSVLIFLSSRGMYLTQTHYIQKHTYKSSWSTRSGCLLVFFPQ